MKRAIAALITFVLLAAVLFVSMRTPDRRAVDETDSSLRTAFSDSSTAEPAPEDCIEQMFEAAERGDVAGYLDCFTGVEREQLDRQLKDQSRDAFARSLIDAVQQLKGHAVHQARTQNDVAHLMVERVYASRNERQQYELVRRGATWRIAVVHRAEPFQPDIPYGTPVYQPPSTKEAE